MNYRHLKKSAGTAKKLFPLALATNEGRTIYVLYLAPVPRSKRAAVNVPFLYSHKKGSYFFVGGADALPHTASDEADEVMDLVTHKRVVSLGSPLELQFGDQLALMPKGKLLCRRDTISFIVGDLTALICGFPALNLQTL